MTQHDNILIVPVPEDASGFRIHIDDATWLFFWTVTGWEGMDSEKLPPGPWRIVGRAKELTEGQWREVVQSFGENRYYNYESGSQYHECLKSTATESGMSLLRSKGIDPESNPIILIKGKEVV